MYLVFFLIWIIFNGQLTLEIAAFGVVVAGVMYFFICKFLGYSPRMDRIVLRKAAGIIQYLFVLIKEIIKANVSLIRMVLSVRYEIEPAVVCFRVDLKTKAARVLLANSITLTPGTITVSLKEDEYVVHCLDKSLAKGINDSIFVKLLEKLERVE